jgi:hypothetical protein
MDEIKPIPRNRTLGYIADALRSGKDKMGNAFSGANRDYALPFGLGTKRLNVGDFATNMVFGDAPDEVDRWSQGDAPMRMNNPRGSKAMFEIKDGRAGPLADAAFMGADVAGVAGVAGLAAKGAARMVQSLRKAPNVPAGYNKAPTTPEPTMSEPVDPSRRDALKKIAGGTAIAAGVGATAPDALRAVITKAVEASPMMGKAAEVASVGDKIAPMAKAFHFQGFKPWAGKWSELTPYMEGYMRHGFALDLADDAVKDPIKRADFDDIAKRWDKDPETGGGSGFDSPEHEMMEKGYLKYDADALGERGLSDGAEWERELYKNDPSFAPEAIKKRKELRDSMPQESFKIPGFDD